MLGLKIDDRRPSRFDRVLGTVHPGAVVEVEGLSGLHLVVWSAAGLALVDLDDGFIDVACPLWICRVVRARLVVD
jgi:hypothetical protein